VVCFGLIVGRVPCYIEKVEGPVGTEQENEIIAEQMEQQEADGVKETAAIDAGLTGEEKLIAAQEEIAGYQDKMLRAAAEFDNYKKRMERDRSAAMKYVGEHILREILPVVDNLERALAQGAVEGVEAETKLAALLEGVQLTLKGLLATLEKFEVRSINSVGQPFDPNIQEALAMEASDVVPVNHVLSEFEKGYYYKDRLLRVARVIVSSGKAGS